MGEVHNFPYYKGLIELLFKQDMSQLVNQTDVYQIMECMAEEPWYKEHDEFRQYLVKVVVANRAWAKYSLSQPDADKEEHSKIYWGEMLTGARNMDIDSYLLYLERKREPKAQFYLPRRDIFLKHGVIQGLQGLLIDDKYDIMGLSMPPGTGKSTVGLNTMSGLMGWFPEMPNLASAHSGSLTRSFYDGVAQIITDKDEYSWHEIFPNVPFLARADLNAKEQTINVGKAKRFKSLTCRAINASLTGATRCEKLLYADDLCSGLEEALNPERLDKLYQVYTTDLKTRMKLNCKELQIQTRWSVHDVLGRVQRENYGNKRAIFINVPALDENGESNFDYKYGVGFNKYYFMNMKKSMDDVSFRCLYQGEPIEREGLLYHDNDFRRYIDLPLEEPDAILGICDTKDRGSDYMFMPIMYQYGDDYYFEDCAYSNDQVEVCDRLCVDTIVKHNPHKIQFESNSAGGRTADAIAKIVKTHGVRTQITKKFTTSNKETKIVVNSGWIKEHVLLKDQSTYKEGGMYSQALTALFSYTQMGRNKHDDVPDGMAMFAEFVAKRVAVKDTRIMESPF